MSERVLYEFLAGGQWWDIKKVGKKFYHRSTNGKSPWRPSLPDGLTSEDLALIHSKLSDE